MKPCVKILAALLVAVSTTGCAGMIKEQVEKNSLALWNDGKLDLIDQNYTPEAATAERAEYNRVKGEYDNFTLKVDHLALDGNYLASVWSFTGTHKASGKAMTASGTSFALIEGQKVSKVFRNWDTLKEKLDVGYTLVEPAKP